MRTEVPGQDDDDKDNSEKSGKDKDDDSNVRLVQDNDEKN